MDATKNDLTIAFMGKALELLSARQSTIAGNIANVNTPGYCRRDIDFAGELAAALGKENVASKDERINLVNKIKPQILVDQSFYYRNDLGAVDIDREMAEQARTQLLYNTFSRLISKRFDMYRTIITEGRG